MAKKKYSRQQVKKLFDKCCFFCDEDRYEVLDCHRIFEGEKGGTYHPSNTLTICALCHRLIHSGHIKIFGRYLSTNGMHVIHYEDSGVEKWQIEPKYRHDDIQTIPGRVGEPKCGSTEANNGSSCENPSANGRESGDESYSAGRPSC